MQFPLPSERVVDRCKENDIIPEIMKPGEAEPLREAIVNQYTHHEFSEWKNYKTTWIWSAFIEENYISVQDCDPYQSLDLFLLNRNFILFFNYFEDKSVIKFPRGVPISLLMGPDDMKEFYLSDEDAAFLLCYNHEQFLLGCGEAKAWMSEHDF